MDSLIDYLWGVSIGNGTKVAEEDWELAPPSPEQNKLTCSFDNLDNHINPETNKDLAFTEIFNTIKNCYEETDIPVSARLLENCQVYLVSSDDPLYERLDEESQKTTNFLLYSRKENDVSVIQFGPFSDGDVDGDLCVKIFKSHILLNEILEAFGWLENEDDEDGNCKKESKESIKVEVIAKYQATVDKTLEEIKAKEKELSAIAYEVLDKSTADKLTQKLTASTGKVMFKGAGLILLAQVMEEVGKRLVATLTAKTAVKTAAKHGSKHGSKMAVKSVPLVGLAVGLGFGAWRLWDGDATGATLEVISGAAACVPGSGTAASLAIDAGLVARDVSEAKSRSKRQVEDIQEEIDQIQKDLKQLYESYHGAVAECEFVQQVLKDSKFTVGKLELEMKILDEVVLVLDSFDKN